MERESNNSSHTHKVIAMKKTLFFLSLSVTFLISIAACSQSPVPIHGQTSSTNDQEQWNKKIIEAINSGNYRNAVALTRKADAGKAEIDFAVGELVLQGWADPEAQQRPFETVDQALALLETSALAGHRQAIAALAATFYTGVRKDMTGEFLVKPNEILQACWEAAKTEPSGTESCITMRSKN